MPGVNRVDYNKGVAVLLISGVLMLGVNWVNYDEGVTVLMSGPITVTCPDYQD